MQSNADNTPQVNFEDAVPEDGQLNRIGTLANRALEQEREVVLATRALNLALQAYRATVDEALPLAMANARTKDFTTEDGHRIQVRTVFNSLKLVDEEGLAWVEEHEGADNIRTVITIEFPKESLERAKIFYERLTGLDVLKSSKLKLERYVHDKTIGAFAKSRLEAGDDPPLELLGVTRRSYAVVGKSRTKTMELKGFDFKE